MSVDTAAFVLADIPGLIEGAHEGVGIGDRFLGHIERCAILLHLVDATTEDPAADYITVRTELDNYGNGLEEKREIVALSKIDAVSPERLQDVRIEVEQAAGKKPIEISAATGKGVSSAMATLLQVINRTRDKEREDALVDEENTGWQP